MLRFQPVWPWKQNRNRAGFPHGFRIQAIGVEAAKAISARAPSEIASYFRENPDIATALINESYDKRYSPSSFIVAEGNGLFRVGWFTRDANYLCIKEFSNLADAATDYLLFSLGKGRWPDDSVRNSR